MAELTGPKNCCECGAEFTREIILAGGSEPATIIIRGHQIPVPGLYRCTGCHEAVKNGWRGTAVTLQTARDFLNDTFGPMVVGVVLSGQHGEQAVSRLFEVIDLQTALEVCIRFQDEPGGLDFIPECDGKCGDDHEHDGLPNGQRRSTIEQN
jgi:hypothetical protein